MPELEVDFSPQVENINPSTHTENKTVENPLLINQAMNVYIEEANKIAVSENPHEVDTFNKYLSLVKELRSYVEMGAINQDNADKIMALQLTKGELNSLIDETTGLIGEKGFNLILDHTLARANRSDEKFSLAYLDLRGFKDVNDKEGHQRGDEILKLVGEYLNSNVRKGDVVSRLHGDEFAILFQGATEEDSKNRFNLDTLSYNLPIHIRNKLFEQHKEPNIAIVSARAGFASYEKGDSIETLKHRADIEMNNERENEQETSR